jgi:hypothetical protein
MNIVELSEVVVSPVEVGMPSVRVMLLGEVLENLMVLL